MNKVIRDLLPSDGATHGHTQRNFRADLAGERISSSDTALMNVEHGKETDTVKLHFVSPDGGRRSSVGHFRLFGNRCLVVNTNEQIAPATAISAEYKDVLFIGEVVDMKPALDSSWLVQIKVEHTLTEMEDLISLRR